ncbi:MAG TPA: tetratricopeptide repeat protein [Tepidisphaeraceae bacterium]|nr:tetratricopeptide repeat protein [Tepidisphaeraceae bacterium]
MGNPLHTSSPLDVAEPPLLDAASLHERGLAFARERRFAEAVSSFKHAAEADPDRAEYVRHLAQACVDHGALAEAEAAWGQFLRLSPDDAEAHRHLGNLRRRMDKLDQAIESLKRAAELAADPTSAELDLGIAQAGAKRYPEAKLTFEKVLTRHPDSYDAQLNLGMLFQEMKDDGQALAFLRKAVEQRPRDPSGLNNLGVALSNQGKFSEAVGIFERLLTDAPDYTLAWNNLGNALRSLGRNEEAVAALERAIELRPDYTEAYNNLGIIYAQLEKFDEAIRLYDKALLLRPDYPEAHANRGLVYLLMGNFQQGWADYEWRWHGGHGLKRRSYGGRLWDGSPLVGRRILLHYEQGLGDTFQFIRYAKELKNRGATVVFECQASTRQILSRTPGIDEFVIRGEKPPQCEFYAPLLTLPGTCQTNLDTLPRRVPYVFGDPAQTWDWKQRLAQVAGFRIGIVWQGNPEHKGDRNRSIPLRCFAPLANLPGVQLVSLQKNLGVEQIEQLGGLFTPVDFKGIAEGGDGWLRTAAIVANLDLVITADTSVAHLCGAMGVPIWVALPTSPDWRWLLEREDTPWYPTMRLFRQAQPGDWDELFARIAEAVRQRLVMSDRNLRDRAPHVDRLEAERLLVLAGEHIQRDEHELARPLLEHAVQLDPSNGAVHQDLGVTYAKQGRLREGINCFRRALELTPDSAGLYGNLGLACLHAGQVEESVSHLRKAILLGASSADTHKNLARALMRVPDPAAAEESYWAALRLKPDDAEAHYHLSQSLLMQGKFEQGWLEYEWRDRWLKQAKRRFDRPRWSGQTIAGNRLLLVAEESLSETLQLVRYADLLERWGVHVILECQAELVATLSGCLGLRQVVMRGAALPPYDFHAPLPSLPAIIKTTLQTIPATRPYIGVPADVLRDWQVAVHAIAGPKRVAVSLQAESALGVISARQRMLVYLAEWAGSRHDLSLVDIPVGDLHGHQAEEGQQRPPALLTLDALRSTVQSSSDWWQDVAAALRNVDLLVTADNAVAHLAGAMGVQTWVVLPTAPEARWMTHRADTPWYPTIRLFRQRFRQGWNEVAEQIVGALKDLPATAKLPPEC